MSIRWTIARARQRFSELIRAARSEPQPIYNRDQLVAAVVDAEAYLRFVDWSRPQQAETIAEAFEKLRAIAPDEDDPLHAPPRGDRDNPILPALDDLPG